MKSAAYHDQGHLGRDDHRPSRPTHRSTLRASALAALVLGALLVPTTLAGTPASPIIAFGDAQLAAAVAAVGGTGSGTALDPFVISGIDITHSSIAGIYLQGTRAHLRLDDVNIHTNPGTGGYGIIAVDAWNVVVSGGSYVGDVVGILAQDAPSFAVRDATVQGRTHACIGSNNVASFIIERTTMHECAQSGFQSANVASLTVTDSVIETAGFHGVFFAGSTAGTLAVTGTAIRNTTFDGVASNVDATLTSATISDNDVALVGRVGINVAGIFNGLTIADNHVRDTGSFGIAVSDSKARTSNNVQVLRNTVVDSRQGGVAVTSVVNGVTLHGNHVTEAFEPTDPFNSLGAAIAYHNAHAGTTATGVVVTGNTATDNYGHGISVVGVGTITTTHIEDNDAHRNGIQGIVVWQDVVAPTVRANRADDNGHHGILIANPDGALVEDNAVQGNSVLSAGGSGIAILDGSNDAIVRSNQVHDTTNCGVGLDSSSRAAIEGNEITGGNFGVCILDLFAPGVPTDDNAVTGNDIADVVLDGIHVATWPPAVGHPDRPVRTLVEGNFVANAGRSGAIHAHAASTEVRNNTFNATTNGAVIAVGPDNVVDGNTVIDHVGVGAWLADTTGSIMTNNRITAAGGAPIGLALTNDVGSFVADNVATDHRFVQPDGTLNGVGIFAQNSVDMEITRNVVRDNFLGILTQTTVGGIVYDNSFTNDENAWVVGTVGTLWNLAAPVPGPNVIGGPFVQGNHWSDLIGVDVDGNGVSELPYIPLPVRLHVDTVTVTTPLNAFLNMPQFDGGPLMSTIAIVGPVTADVTDDVDVVGVVGPNEGAPTSADGHDPDEVQPPVRTPPDVELPLELAPGLGETPAIGPPELAGLRAGPLPTSFDGPVETR